MTKIYYIWDTRKTADGGLAVFWAHRGHGYTKDLDLAGLFAEDEVEALRPRLGTTQVPLPCELVEAQARRTVLANNLPWPRSEPDGRQVLP